MKRPDQEGSSSPENIPGGMSEIMCSACGAPYGAVSDPYKKRHCNACGYIGTMVLKLVEAGNQVSMVTIGLGIEQAQGNGKGNQGNHQDGTE